MPTPLREHQHELVGDHGVSVVFGTEDTGVLTLTRPTVLAGTARTADKERPQEPGVAMGRDYRGNKTIQFTFGVITDAQLEHANPHRANLDALADFEAAWTDERWSDNPQAYAILRTCEAGRVHRCYGRPRAYDEIAGALTEQGYTPATAQFVLQDDKWYADDPTILNIAGEATSGQGVSAPVRAPVGTRGVEPVRRDFVVGGKVPTWPVITFKGPAIDPQVSIDDGALVVGFDGTIPMGYSVTWDPQPWVRTALGSDGASWGGNTSPRTTAMARATLRPGTHTIDFRATDPTGTASFTMLWRDARPRP